MSKGKGSPKEMIMHQTHAKQKGHTLSLVFNAAESRIPVAVLRMMAARSKRHDKRASRRTTKQKLFS